MKKQVRKLSLTRETLTSLAQANGGSWTETAWSYCFCTALSACCTNDKCPSQLCW